MADNRIPGLDKLIEPLAAEVGKLVSIDTMMLMSIAVSAKRIADAVADDGEDSFFRRPINNYGETIGEAIQGQILRGNAGVDHR